MATLTLDRPVTDAPARLPLSARPQLAWVDALRAFLALLVVAHHAGQPYGGGGDWPVREDVRSQTLSTFFAVNASFFMGLFFLLAAVFVPMSFDRKGASTFVGDRISRLGVPLVVFGVGVFGVIAWIDAGREAPLPEFMIRDYIGQGRIELNHLWFLTHLLAYCCLYAIFRVVGDRIPAQRRPVTWMPGNRAIATFTIGLAIVTWFVRFSFPIDRWIVIGRFFRVELAHLPQYASLFVIGLVAARGRWMERFPRSVGFSWLAIGLGTGAARYVWDLWPLGDLPRIVASGGATWRSAIWSTWEAVICVGLTIGLLTLARAIATTPPRWVRTIATASLGIYIVHPFLLVPIHLGLEHLSIPPLAKFAIAAVIGIVGSIAVLSAWESCVGSVQRRRLKARTG